MGVSKTIEIDVVNIAFAGQPVKPFDFYITKKKMFVSSIKHLKTGRRKGSTVTNNKMTLEVRTLDFKKLARINGVGSFLVLAFCICMAFWLKSTLPLVFIIPFAILIVFLGHKMSTKNSTIIIDNSTIKIDSLTIEKESFSNYFLNDFGLFMIRVEFLLSNGIIHTIDYKSFGQNAKKFDNFFDELNTIKNKKTQEKSDYQGMHMEQVKSMLPMIYVLMAIVIIIDLWWVYSKLTNSFFPPFYYVLIMNLSFGFFIPYIRKIKKH